MRIYSELDLNTFEAWSGAISTLDRIKNAGMCEALENILEDLYPDGMSDTELNDLLWFEPDMVFKWLGMRTEEQIESEIQEAEDELESLQTDFEEDAEDMTPEERAELYHDDYESDIDELKSRIDELTEEMNTL